MIDNRELLSSAPVDASLQLNAIRRRFLEDVSVVLLTLAIIGLPLSLSRIWQTGLHPNHICHCCTAVVVAIVFLLRRRLSDRWLLSSVLSIFTVLSLAAFLQYGIVSAGFFLAAACIFVAGMAAGLWGGIICAVFYAVVVTIVAHLWISGRLTFPGDVREYMLLPTVWAALSVAGISTTAVFSVAVSEAFTSLRELVGTINGQKQKIEEQVIELTRANRELETAMSEVKTLSGLLPICSHCKSVRDDKGYWTQIESYIREHSDAEFSHSICSDCAKRYHPQAFADR